MLKFITFITHCTNASRKLWELLEQASKLNNFLSAGIMKKGRYLGQICLRFCLQIL